VTVERRPEPPVIRLEEFEGPLELLLTLVERRRLPIAELSLVAVADQYLRQVRTLTSVPPDLLSAFLTIAARLLLLKSRALLPLTDVQEAGEDAELEASADELLGRLETYRAFREAAAEIGRLHQANVSSYAAGARVLEVTEVSATLVGIVPGMLASVLRAIENRSHVPSTDDEPPVRRASVGERLLVLRSVLGERRAVSWAEVAGLTVDEIVATLLAVLEMVRRGELAVVQHNLFGPIRLEALDDRPVPLGGDTR